MNILIVDDEYMIRTGISTVINRDLYVSMVWIIVTTK